MIKFKTDENLGKTVDSVKAGCFGYKPIERLWELRYYGGGHKHSRLCEFNFHSSLENHSFPNFTIAFIPKMPSSKTPSQWYLFKMAGSDMYVLSKEELFMNYGFDVDKFFQSDTFAGTVKLFKKYIENGVKEAEQFIKRQSNASVSDISDAKQFLQIIKSCIPLISNPTVNDRGYKIHEKEIAEKEYENKKVCSDLDLSDKFEKALYDVALCQFSKEKLDTVEVHWSRKGGKLNFVFADLDAVKEASKEEKNEDCKKKEVKTENVEDVLSSKLEEALSKIYGF